MSRLPSIITWKFSSLAYGQGHSAFVTLDRCHLWVARPSLLGMLPSLQAVSCSASLALSQQGITLNLSHHSWSPLPLVLSAWGMENWLLLSSLLQYLTYLRIVLLTQMILGTEGSSRRGLSPHRWNQHTFGYNVQHQRIYCKYNLKKEMKTEMKPHWKSHIKGFYAPFCCPIKYKQDYFWLMCNWNKNNGT